MSSRDNPSTLDGCQTCSRAYRETLNVSTVPSPKSRTTTLEASNLPANTTSGSSRRSPAPQSSIDPSGSGNDTTRRSNVLAHTGGSSPESSSVNGLSQQQETRVSSVLQSVESRVDTQLSMFQQATDHLSGLLTSFKDCLTHLLNHTLSARALQRQQNLRRQLEELEAERGYWEANHRTLEQKLKEAHAKLSKTQQERDELRRLANNGNLINSEKDSDHVIQSKWKQLNYAILSLAANLAKCPMQRPTHDSVEKRLQFVCPSWPKLLEDDEFKELLLHAYLWVLVDCQVFKGRCGIWGGRHAQSLKAMREDLVEIAPDAESPGSPSPSLRYVLGWITQGSTFFEHFFGRNQEACQRLVKIETRGLESFCNIASNKPGVQVHRAIKDIIETALDLDKMVMSSKAIISVDWPVNPQPKHLLFDATTMDAIAHIKDMSAQSAVDFVVAPALIKKGNADGYNYDSKMFLCKALVVCE
ncbi:hypothetical protein FSARC_5587 [Fusarium sarcochroum]|uniref:Uncharacterized protein n=1 Tax=Fusarium sarcochroum TaxID=1208366 RepID=A0A8H4XA10_9HYPO|nr:hypothetical protein FSARC_5587 [Fusarium sarcochroum]